MRRRSRGQTATKRTGGYRPAHAWFGRPGDGVMLKQRRDSGWRWRFRWAQLRVLALAVAVAAIAWWQVWTSAH